MSLGSPETSKRAFCSDWKRAPLGGRPGKRASSVAAYWLSLGVTFPASGAMFTQSITIVPGEHRYTVTHRYTQRHTQVHTVTPSVVSLSSVCAPLRRCYCDYFTFVVVLCASLFCMIILRSIKNCC